MKENKRINWLLILQGWTMLWVVIGHAYLGEHTKGPEWENILGSIAYSFHMPLFMLISGWLFYRTRLKIKEPNGGGQKWSYKQIIKDKVIRLLLPGIVFTFIAFVVKIALPGEMVRQTGFGVKELVFAFLYPYDNPFREYWFISTLFCFFLMTPIWKLVLRKMPMMLVMIVVLIVLHFLPIETKLLSIDRVCNHAIWFYLGIVISKECLVETMLAKQVWLTLIIGIAVYVFGTIANPFITTLGGIIFSFGLALGADKLTPRLFWSFRNYTYQIFLMGIFAQILVKILNRHISMPYIGAYILCILMGLYVPVLVSKLIEKINWKPLSLCVGLKPIMK